MSDLVGALAFAGMLALAAAVSHRPSVRRRADLFIAYMVGITFAVGLTQKDLWPVVSWPLVAGELPPVVTQRRIVAVAASGREHDIDYRAWYPLSLDELLGWIDPVFARLEEDRQREATAFLLQKAEQARREALTTGSLDSFDRILGPFTAPFFLLHPKHWDDPERIPTERFVGMRYYYESWSPELLATGQDTIRRQLLYELHEER